MSNPLAGGTARSDDRRALLGELYPPVDAAWAGAELDRLVTEHRGPTRPPLDERAAWIIAYPDHVTESDQTPLAALVSFVADELSLAIDGVHTLPLHPATSDGGFAVADPATVEPTFGSWGDLDRLADAATWMYDLVVNHLSAASTWFHSFLAGDPEYADFFTRLPDGIDTSAVVRPRTSPLAHEYAAASGTERIWTTFSADQVDLDYRNPRVLVAMAEVLVRALDHGAGAVRLDAVPFLWKDPASSSVHLPETHTIVAVLRSVMAEVAPGALLVTETNVPQPENLSYVGTADRPEADAVYQFPLPPLVAHAVLTGDTEPLRTFARSIGSPRPGTTFLNVLATHDGIGLRPADGWLSPDQIAGLAERAIAASGVVNHRSTPDGDVPYELAVAWFSLMSEGVDADTALARHLASHAVALALPGIPLLYLNSLFAVGNDTDTYARTGHGRDLNRARLGRPLLDAALGDPTSVAARSWTGLRRLLDARRTDPAFHPLATHRILASPPGTIAIERANGDRRAVVAIELAGRPVRVAGQRLAPYEVLWSRSVATDRDRS